MYRISVILLIALTIPACTRNQREVELSRIETRHNESLRDLSASLPPTDPRKPGVDLLAHETGEIIKHLPVIQPAEKLPAIPFQKAVIAAEQTESAALSAGKSEAEAERLGLGIATQITMDNSGAAASAIQSFAAAPSGGDGVLGGIESALKGVLGFLGPWGSAASVLVSGLFGIGKWVSNRRLVGRTKSMVEGFEDAKDAALVAMKTNGVGGIFGDKHVRDAMNNAMAGAQAVLPDYADLVKEIAVIKQGYKTAGKKKKG